jgi:glucose/arabinose dehydrogenase
MTRVSASVRLHTAVLLVLACGDGNEPPPARTLGAPLLPHVPAALPLTAADVLEVPAPVLRPRGGVGEVVLPGGVSPARVRLEHADGQVLFELLGNVRGNRVTAASALGASDALRIHVEAGTNALAEAASDLTFVDQDGTTRVVYLPALSVPSGSSTEYWVASDGATYAATPGALSPEFATLARPRIAWKLSSDVQVSLVATGFQHPTHLAFVPNPGLGASDPAFYVLERQGTVGVVARNGSVSTYASELLNFDPSSIGLGDEGLLGMAVEPESGDVYVALTYSANADDSDAPHYAAIERLSSSDGGRTADTRTRIRSFEPEAEGSDHFISDLSFGPDGLLYVLLGDAGRAASAGDLDRYHGKLLRLTLDGAPATGNPYYNADDGITPRDFVYALGLNAPRGAVWRVSDGGHYFLETGLGVERFYQSAFGADFSLAGLPPPAVYTWSPSVSPRQIAFIENGRFTGSGFPNAYLGRAYVTQSAGAGAGDSRHKAITEWQLNSEGLLSTGPRPIAIYQGTGAAAPAGLAAGPDGLYFSDLRAEDPHDLDPQRASILRLSYQAPAAPPDCNQNGMSDAQDLATGTSLDCNQQHIPDECDLVTRRSRDCNHNAVPDDCEITVPFALDLDAATSSLTLLGAARLNAAALELRPAAGEPASALAPATLGLTEPFRVRFELQVDGLGLEGLALSLFDGNSEPTFGVSGPESALVVGIDTREPDSGPRGTLFVAYADQVLGRYVPSLALLDAQPHWVDVWLEAGRLSVSLGALDGNVETAFAALEVPGYTPFVGRFGFGASTTGRAVTATLRDISVWAGTGLDTNANGRLDSCECFADIDDGQSTGEPDGLVTDDDLRYFLTLFGAGASAADVDDGSGAGVPDGVINIFDVRYFLSHFRAGC